MTLPERPGFMQVLPVFDILALLLIFLLMGPTFIVKRGVDVSLPVLDLPLTRYQDPITVTLSAGDNPAVFLAGRRMELNELGEGLDELLQSGRWEAGDTVLLRVDKSLAVERQMDVIQIVKSRALNCALEIRTAQDR